MACNVESSAFDASVLLIPVPEAILSISSALVIYVSPLSSENILRKNNTLQ
jgi:hypothetical protein